MISQGPDRAQLIWSPPLNPNGVISGYVVTYQLKNRGMCSEGGPGREMSFNSPSPGYTIEGLSPHSLYRVSVAARTNTLGEPVSDEFRTEGAPPTGPPRAVSGRSLSPTTAVLSWQAPPCLATNGEISEYEYEIRGTDPWATTQRQQGQSPESTVNVDGLTPFTNYVLKVRAFTNRGAGPWSPEVPFRTASASAPNAPIDLRFPHTLSLRTSLTSPTNDYSIVDSDANSVTVMWQSPAPPGAEIDQYKVRSSVAGRSAWREQEEAPYASRCSAEVLRDQRAQPAPGAQFHCALVTGLQPEQLYEFQVPSPPFPG